MNTTKAAALKTAFDSAPVYRVTYSGFLGPVTREFPTPERAEQWARQAGVYRRATFTRG